MTLGKRIYDLRTAKNLSQGDLAEALDVSRQSVSKWETDTSVPDLDKLVKLCDLFGVSLDELVRKRSPGQDAVQQSMKAEEPLDPVQAGKRRSKTRIAIGVIFICVAVLGVGPVLIMDNLGWFVVAGAALIAFLVGGIVCLSVRNHTVLWTFWSMMFSCYTAYAVENTVGIWNIIRTFPGNAYQLAPNFVILIVMILILTATVLLVRKRKGK